MPAEQQPVFTVSSASTIEHRAAIQDFTAMVAQNPTVVRQVLGVHELAPAEIRSDSSLEHAKRVVDRLLGTGADGYLSVKGMPPGILENNPAYSTAHTEWRNLNLASKMNAEKEAAAKERMRRIKLDIFIGCVASQTTATGQERLAA